MDAHAETSAVVVDEGGARAGRAARPGKAKKVVGLLLCLGAAGAAAAGWAHARSGGEETDNAYVRGDLTALAPKIAGYVTAVASITRAVPLSRTVSAHDARRVDLGADSTAPDTRHIGEVARLKPAA